MRQKCEITARKLSLFTIGSKDGITSIYYERNKKKSAMVGRFHCQPCSAGWTYFWKPKGCIRKARLSTLVSDSQQELIQIPTLIRAEVDEIVDHNPWITNISVLNMEWTWALWSPWTYLSVLP